MLQLRIIFLFNIQKLQDKLHGIKIFTKINLQGIYNLINISEKKIKNNVLYRIWTL